MNTLTHVGNLFAFIGGLGMFLYGMDIMASGLQKTAGNKMKDLLGYLTNNRILGVLVGALVTAIIQSSSATTVMVVGFVNAGIMNLTQAAGVIMGANVGTTITAWLVSANEWAGALKPDFFAPFILGIGAFIITFSNKQKMTQKAEIAVGFGILFIGLSSMSSSIGVYQDSPVFYKAFQVLGGNPILGILVGAVVTAIIQSSSASVGILQTLAMRGIVNWRSAIFITLGQNIGTCITAILSSAGANKTAKRAAVIHLSFNVLGAAIYGVIMTWDFILRLFVAGALGTVIGLDREYRAKEAGYRTHFLVSLGSALIMIVSQYGFMEVVKMEGIDLDPSRVAAQVVSGIGFIGAGTIIFQKQIVRGLTTAAGIWATSGIGLAIGAGMYWLGISATILTLIGLEALSYLFKSIGMKSSMVEFSTDNKETLNRMAKKFNSKEYNIVSYQLDEKRLGEVTTYYVTMVIKSKKYNDEGMLLTLLQDFSDITVHRLE